MVTEMSSGGESPSPLLEADSSSVIAITIHERPLY